MQVRVLQDAFFLLAPTGEMLSITHFFLDSWQSRHIEGSSIETIPNPSLRAQRSNLAYGCGWYAKAGSPRPLKGPRDDDLYVFSAEQ